MTKSSFIYKSIPAYRMMMTLLYRGKYFKRFGPVLKHISGEKVIELCFGDTLIANYCAKKNINWTGIDINEIFVKNAQHKGFNALQKDINSIDFFPKADTCILCGSLYHFHENLKTLIVKMLECAPKIIISEPVNNLSNNKGIIGKLAKASASVNGKKQEFRFDENSLITSIKKLSIELQFNYTIEERFDKDIILVIKKCKK